MPVVDDAQLTAWSEPQADAEQTVASATEKLTHAVEILNESFGEVRLTQQGSYARSTAIAGSDMDFLLYHCDVQATDATAWHDYERRRYTEFVAHTEAALRGWFEAAETPRRAIWTRVEGLEVHVLPVLPYTAPTGVSGAWFWWASGVDPTVTYSELITKRIKKRDADASGRYCEVVRILKNLSKATYRESDNLAGSSMIESLVYDVSPGALCPGAALRDSCVSVIDTLTQRLESAAVTMTDPSGLVRLFDGIERDPDYDEATTFLWEARAQMI